MNAQMVTVMDNGDMIMTNCNYDPNTNIASEIQVVDYYGSANYVEEEYLMYNGKKVYNFMDEDEANNEGELTEDDVDLLQSINEYLDKSKNN